MNIVSIHSGIDVVDKEQIERKMHHPQRTIVIQAGGESRRMGSDKGLLPFLGKTLIERVIQQVKNLPVGVSLADELIITTNNPEAYSFLGVRMAKDVFPNRGALGGLYTALSAASHDLVGVVACDMPFASPGLLEALFIKLDQGGFDAALPKTPNGFEPFHAVYRRETCLPLVRQALEENAWRVDSWFGKAQVFLLSTQEVQKHDPNGIAFWNINTPQELELAEQQARE